MQTQEIIQKVESGECVACGPQDLQPTGDTQTDPDIGAVAEGKYCPCCGRDYYYAGDYFIALGSRPPELGHEFRCAIEHPEHRWPTAETTRQNPKPTVNDAPWRETFHSPTCDGEICVLCDGGATHKIVEEIPTDEPVQQVEGVFYERHGYISYVCCRCFGRIFGRTSHPGEYKGAIVNVLQG